MLDAWFAGSAAFADWFGALFALLVSADSPAFAFELLVVACPAALLEPDAWLSLTLAWRLPCLQRSQPWKGCLRCQLWGFVLL